MSIEDNADAWVDAWFDLNFLVDEHKVTDVLLPDGTEATLNEAKKWLQDTLGGSTSVSFSIETHNGKQVVLITAEA
ncbi:hypothetical protein [Oceanospirillum sediminis]|uniref:Uncharacterized protein n=1 Tax=Oceanospirillum sediminis TaxID=2760088 RepID=A0A839IYY2_9GAMM|nr:hypothetical protein [Oceanospirillum sediminis]MBB1489649.1 hypothetical protein [Oceanospirillum sediminis]